jgi:hypothetical protein
VNYHRTRYVGGPQLDTPTTEQRADALAVRVAELKAARQQEREDLTWDRVGSDD